MVVKNKGKGTELCSECKHADSFYSRFMGLMGRKTLKPGAGLLIKPCNSIHMFFMNFSIDAVFLNRENEVVHIIEGIKPWRVSRLIKHAHSVLELPSGTARATRTEIGDRLEMFGDR
jgi:uncharacterized membrane protein (UPF0127 family)